MGDDENGVSTRPSRAEYLICQHPIFIPVTIMEAEIESIDDDEVMGNPASRGILHNLHDLQPQIQHMKRNSAHFLSARSRTLDVFCCDMFTTDL